MSEDNQGKCVWLGWSVYTRHKGRLPDAKVKLNIRKFGVASRGAGNNRLVRITPDNLQLFFEESVVAEKKKELFGIQEEQKTEQPTSSLEETIFNAQEKMIQVKELSADALDLSQGVYLTARQLGLLTGYSSEQRVRDIAENDLGLKPRTFYHKTLWYFVDKELLDRFPRPRLSDQELEEICRLSPILKHEIIAEAYEVTRGYVSVLIRSREEELRFKDKVAYSDDRLDYALDLYKDNKNKKVRSLIVENVFKETANDFGNVISENLETYLTPWLGLYREVFGIDDFFIPRIKAEVKRLATAYVLEIILTELAEAQDSPQDVLDETFTLTEFLDNKARQYLTGLIGDDLTICFEEAISYLTTDEQEIIKMRYKEGLSLLGKGYKQPSFEDVGTALELNLLQTRETETAAIEKLRQPELYPTIEEFLLNLFNYIKKIKVGEKADAKH